MDLQIKVRKSRKKKVEVTKLLFLAMDGSGANSWDDLEAFYDSCFKKGLSYDETKEMYDREFRSGTELIFPEKARLVTEIVEKTGAKIIWSSSWRNWFIYKDIEQARKMMLRRGMPGNALIAYTNDFYIFSRRAE